MLISWTAIIASLLVCAAGPATHADTKNTSPLAWVQEKFGSRARPTCEYKRLQIDAEDGEPLSGTDILDRIHREWPTLTPEVWPPMDGADAIRYDIVEHLVSRKRTSFPIVLIPRASLRTITADTDNAELRSDMTFECDTFTCQRNMAVGVTDIPDRVLATRMHSDGIIGDQPLLELLKSLSKKRDIACLRDLCSLRGAPREEGDLVSQAYWASLYAVHPDIVPFGADVQVLEVTCGDKCVVIMATEPLQTAARVVLRIYLEQFPLAVLQIDRTESGDESPAARDARLLTIRSAIELGLTKHGDKGSHQPAKKGGKSSKSGKRAQSGGRR